MNSKLIFNINEFSSSENSNLFNVVGSAKITNKILRITPSEPSQIGAVWLKEKQDIENGFESIFTFQIIGAGLFSLYIYRIFYLKELMGLLLLFKIKECLQ